MKCSDSQVPSTRSLFNRCLILNNNEKKDNEEDNTSQRCEPLEGKTDKDPSPSKVEIFKRLFPSWTPKVLIHSESTKKRSIIVGDIHGCSQELRDLLTRLSFDPAEDALFHVGDLVGKGPDSHGVVQIMREVGALGVMGNHDWLALRSAGRLEPPLDPDQTSSQPSLGLTDEDLDYLKQLPHMIHLKQFSVLIVHAAVNVVKTCTRTHPFVCMHGRTVDERNRIHPKFNGTPWASKYTGKLHVVFGHDARRGRQEYPNATGLDSGCVYGVSLTAMILPDRTLVSVPSYKVYCQQSAEVNPSLVEDEQEPEEIVQEME